MAKMRCVLSTLLFLVAATYIQAKVTDNPADELVEEINKNRTGAKGSALYSNQGLACIALQYIKAYGGDCGAVGQSKKPSESLFSQTFAPNCGVRASTLSPITGRVIACQSHYADSEKAFSEILMKPGKENLDLIRSRNHTEVGAAVSGSDGGGPYFWCVLFSNGTRNGSFVPENGTAIISKPGCFSGANDQCSRAAGGLIVPAQILGALVAVGFAFSFFFS